jgi:hypothetical protein
MRTKFLIFFLLIFTGVGYSQVFTEVHTQLKGVMEPVVEWIDLPGSNHYGVWISGDAFKNNEHYVISRLNKYKDKDHLVYGDVNLPAVYSGASASADFDKDGDNDLVITGLNKYNTPIMRLFKNMGAYRFKEVNVMFKPVVDGSVVWGDYDQDDDLDLLVTGRDVNNRLSTVIYRNDEGAFTETYTGVPGVYFGNADWGFFDSDGYLDILITGDAGGQPYSAVYLYRNGVYKKLAQNLIPLKHSFGKFGDLDGDGDLDIILSGEDEYGYPDCKVYSNENGVLVQVPTSIRALKNCTIDLGDEDHDGDLDIVMTGESMERPYTIVYENLGKFNFRDMMAGIPGISSGIAKWGNYDGDNDLDLVVTGLTLCYDFIAKVYKNNTNPVVKKEEAASIFIEAEIPDYNKGPYYYYVFSSGYCDPSGGDHKDYHLYISNIHKEFNKYELTYKFNDLLLKQVPNWPETDRGHRTSNGFHTYKEAEMSRNQIIDSYKTNGFKIHYLNW